MIAALLAASLFTRTVRQSDVFAPPREPHGTFAQTARQMNAVTLTYRTRDGAVLRGFLLPAVRPKAPYVLLFYGNAELVQYEDDRLAWLRRLGYNAVCFDYRGYGYSSGSPDGQRIRKDSVALYDRLVRDIEPSHAPAFVYGVSLGTQFAIHVASQRRVRGIVLQSPAASAQEEVTWFGRQALGITGLLMHLVPSPQVAEIFQGRSEIAAARAPLIVVHGARDTLIPIAQGREVFAAAATSDKRFVEIPDAGHGDIRFDRPPAGPAVAAFLSAH